MATKEMKVYLHVDSRGDDAVFIYEDMSDLGYTLAGSAVASFKMLEHSEIVNKQIALIEKAKTDLQAETGVKLVKLDAQIQNLLAITHDGGAV